jgi:hypothetical protein
MESIRPIVEALVAGATAAARPAATQAVRDAYARFKALIVRRFGAQGDVTVAVEQVAQKPASPGRRRTLAEELGAAGAGRDVEVVQAAKALLALLQPQGTDQSQRARADQGSAAATGRGATAAGSGNIQVTGDVQGGVTIFQSGWPPAAGAEVDTGGYDLQAVRDLLLAAFTAPDLRRLFLYTPNAELRRLSREFGPNDGLNAMVETAIQFCLARRLLPDLLGEVERANPRQYAHFAGRLRAGEG